MSLRALYNTLPSEYSHIDFTSCLCSSSRRHLDCMLVVLHQDSGTQWNFPTLARLRSLDLSLRLRLPPIVRLVAKKLYGVTRCAWASRAQTLSRIGMLHGQCHVQHLWLGRDHRMHLPLLRSSDDEQRQFLGAVPKPIE